MTFFAPKSPKLGNTRKKFCLKPIPTNHTNKKYTIFPHVCVLKFLPYWADFPPYHNRSFNTWILQRQHGLRQTKHPKTQSLTRDELVNCMTGSFFTLPGKLSKK